MAVPTNILQQVALFNNADIGLIQNMYCAISLAEKRFKNFENEEFNLGSSTTFELPYRISSASGLNASFQPIVQRPQTLTCDNAINASIAATNQERIFNIDKSSGSQIPMVLKSAAAAIGTPIEQNILLDTVSSRPVYNIVNGVQVPTGGFHTEAGPYQFFGDGVTAINSYQQLEQMVQNWRVAGSQEEIKVILPNLVVPPIIGSGLNQFALNRNNEIAMSWDLGSFGDPMTRYYKSNLLPIHTSGTVGNASSPSNVLTITAVNYDSTNTYVQSLTCSGATANDQNAVLNGDLFQFVAGVTGYQNVYKSTFIGQAPTPLLAQNRVVGNSPANGSGIVTLNLAVPFQFSGIVNNTAQAVTTQIVPGMKIKLYPSHIAGILLSGPAMYLSMPRLPSTDPFMNHIATDEKSGCSIRMYKGTLLTQNFYGWICDAVWGSTIVPEQSARILFPITSTIV